MHIHLVRAPLASAPFIALRFRRVDVHIDHCAVVSKSVYTGVIPLRVFQPRLFGKRGE